MVTAILRSPFSPPLGRCLPRPTSSCRTLARLCAIALVGALVPLGAAAAPAGAHRARLSADLADHLAAGSQAVRVIIHGSRSEVDAVAARYNLRVLRYLKSGAVLEVNAGQLAALRDDDAVDHLSGDIRIRSSVDAVNLEAIGVDQVWAGSDDVPALSGKGVTVAVIDSGIDTRHNALKKRVVYVKDFTGGDGSDGYGHGTHVAAIIAGQGGKTTETQAYRGVAPGASLINLRVLGNDGSGEASDVVEAIDWAIDHQRDYNIRVINLSLGGPVLQPYRDDPLCEAVERAVRAGIAVVAAAGNYGKTTDGVSVYGGITTPANSPYAIAVGALDTHGTAARSDDTVASYSSKGPTRYDLILKPDLVAPGSHVASAEAGDSYLSRTYPQNHLSGTGPTAVMQLSGTSMAAGVVSGAVALLIDERPNLNPLDARSWLRVSSTFLPEAGLVGAGAGSIDLATAVQNTRPAIPSLQTGWKSRSGRKSQNGLPSVAEAIWKVDNNTIIWGTFDGDTIIWGSADGDTIIWGSADRNTIILGSADGDTIIWGSVAANTIIWGSAMSANTIIWGSVDASTIIWGSADGDTIIWGTTLTGEGL